MGAVARGILCDPKGTFIVHYAWGLGNTTKNVFEAYTLWQGVKIAKLRGLQKLFIIVDSMIVIKALINHKDTKIKAIPGEIYQDLILLKDFDE